MCVRGSCSCKDLPGVLKLFDAHMTVDEEDTSRTSEVRRM